MILSCTSTPARLEILRTTLPSLLAQTLRPDRFVIHLGRDGFRDGSAAEALLPEIRGIDGVEVRLVDDLGPYTKLLPALADASDDELVITVDDDVVYAPHLLARLVAAAHEYPHAICCGRARRIRRGVIAGFRQYRSWPHVTQAMQGMPFLPLGVGGVAYRRRLLDLDFIFDPAARTLAPTADDLWFRAASLLRRTEVVVVPDAWEGSEELEHDFALWATNGDAPQTNLRPSRVAKLHDKLLGGPGPHHSVNDEQWRAVRAHMRSVRNLRRGAA